MLKVPPRQVWTAQHCHTTALTKSTQLYIMHHILHRVTECVSSFLTAHMSISCYRAAVVGKLFGAKAGQTDKLSAGWTGKFYFKKNT